MRLFDSILRLLGRLRLWQQFAILGLFIITFPTISITQKFLDSGRLILTEHEIIDLSDESNLRVNEIREEFEYLTRDLGQVSLRLGASPTPAEVSAAVRSFAVDWERSIPGPGESATTPAEVRRRFFSGSLVGVAAGPLQGPADRRSLLVRDYATPGGSSNRASPAVQVVLNDLAQRTDRPGPNFLSGFHLDRDGGPRCLIAVGRPYRWVDGRPSELFVVIIDFTRYIGNRSRGSPRHQYLVTDAKGTLLVHPNTEWVLSGKTLPEVTRWEFPEGSWVGPAEANDPGLRMRRMARMLREGGARLPGVAVPELAFYYQKGNFSGELGKILGDRGPAEIADLQRRLFQLAQERPGFRYGEPGLKSNYIELSHPSRKELIEITRQVDDWWVGVKGSEAKIDWVEPLHCERMQGQLTYLRVDPGDDVEPPRLVVAAALEELSEDIDTRFISIVWWWVVPSAVMAVAFGVLLIVVLTRSLRRLAGTAERITEARSADTPITGGGCLEVSQLATTLRGMVAQLRDDTARYQTILRAAGEGIVVASGEGLIEEANRAAARMFGFEKPEELVHRRVTELIVDPLPGVTAMMAPVVPDPATTSSISRTDPYFDAVRGRRRDGTVFWIEVTMRPVALKERQVITCVFRDVSQRKAAEEQIRRMNEGLESRVRVRTAELAETNTKLEVALKQAEAASRAKDAFVANMSHELRQPLHIIIGFTEALKEEAEDRGHQELVPDLNKILSAGKHLLELINDLLDLAKIAAGRMEVSSTRFDVTKMLNNVRSLVGPLAEKNSNVFQLDLADDLGTMHSDERRVKQILINVLSNAFKFTSAGTVTLQVRRVTVGARDLIRFTIRDTGKGMTAEQVNRLFQRFYQADPSTTREQGGTGLGLAITQSFNQLLGGEPVQVRSQPGEGSEFIITLPAQMEGAAPIPREPIKIETEITAPRKAPIVVIDDDPMVLELMTRYLQKEGYQVRTATTASEGIRLVRETNPALVTLDVMMPGMDGWAALAQLKADPSTSDVPVVMVSLLDERGRGYALGAADYLTKPIDWSRLGNVIRRHVGSDRLSTLLIIDDDPACREMVRRHLEKDGIRTIEAADGEAGLRLLARESPSLILLDLMMPVMDGFGFLEQYHQRYPGSETPIVVLTARDLTIQDFERLNGRVARILGKGNFEDPATLIEMIRRTARSSAE